MSSMLPKPKCVYMLTIHRDLSIVQISTYRLKQYNP